MQYSLLKSELARELKDVPRINHTYPQANIEVLKKRAEAFLEKAYQKYAPRWEKPSEQMVGAKAKVVSALEELVEAIWAWQIG
jgi:predicted metal-dependent phosphoesterase TrpH